jgi:hypothetical protein
MQLKGPVRMPYIPNRIWVPTHGADLSHKQPQRRWTMVKSRSSTQPTMREEEREEEREGGEQHLYMPIESHQTNWRDQASVALLYLAWLNSMWHPWHATGVQRGTVSHQGEWRDPVQYHAMMVGMKNRARSGNKVFVGSFLKYDF